MEINLDAFCVLPWMHAHIEADGSIKQCCLGADNLVLGDLKKSTLPEILNSEKFKEIRRNYLSGEIPKSCRNCFKMEAVGESTIRQYSNKTYAHLIETKILNTKSDGTLLDTKLSSLDIRMSNLCNYKCRTCYQGASTAWYSDANALAGANLFADVQRPTRTKEELWKLLDELIPSLEEIYILGGEPLLEIENYHLLKELIEKNKTNVRVKVSTNLSKLDGVGEKILDCLQMFPNKIFLLSYDGFGEVGEYVRKGTDWEMIVENHKKLQNKMKDLNFVIITTVSLLNVFHLCDFIRHLVSEGMIDNGEQVSLSILQEPLYFNIKLLTDKQRLLLKKKIENFIDDEVVRMELKNLEFLILELKKVISFTMRRDDIGFDINLERKKFVIHSSRLDKLRNEKTLDVLPEFRDFFLEAVSD